MAIFLTRSNLTRGDLKLFLSNNNGYAQDAASVKWTVYASDGRQVSGSKLDAIRKACGQYYAPFFTDVPNGNYKIVWDVLQDWGSHRVQFTEFFFVVDPSSYSQCGPLNREAVPVQGEFTFLSGQALSVGDLPLYLKNSSGFPQNAFAVFFTILDVGGYPIACKAPAQQAGLGVYFAPWFVSVCSGNYTILWEYMESEHSPMQAIRMGFSVIDPPAPYAVVVPIMCSSSFMNDCAYSGTRPLLTRFLITSCDTYGACDRPFNIEPCPTFVPQPSVPVGPPPSPGGSCCIEVPRSIHLAPQFLPPSGNFTNQAPYKIPDCINHITFYITYTRGAPGGYALLRILWGNGTEENQQTLLDTDITINNANSLQNLFLQDLEGPVPPNDNPVNFMIETRVPGGATTVRVIATEGGVPGGPGFIGITLTAARD